MHTSVGNNSLRESVTAFALAGWIEAPAVVSINVNIAFVVAGNKIRIPVNNILLCVTVGDLDRSEKRRYCVVLNAVLLPSFLTEAAILDGETAAANLLKVFANYIAAKVAEEEYEKSEKEE